jgi:hypothetical protein
MHALVLLSEDDSEQLKHSKTGATDAKYSEQGQN